MPKQKSIPVYLSRPAKAQLESVRGTMRGMHPTISLSQAIELLIANWRQTEVTPEWAKQMSRFEFETKLGRPRRKL